MAVLGGWGEEWRGVRRSVVMEMMNVVRMGSG